MTRAARALLPALSIVCAACGGGATPAVVPHLIAPPALLSLQPLPLPMPTTGVAFERPRRSALMTSLYTSTALMQGLDVHSTLRAFKNGAREGNPLMAGIAIDSVH